MKQFLFSSVLIGALVYSIMVAWLYFYQSNLLYFPDTSKPAPAVAGFPDMEVVGFAADDGLEIYGWYKPAEPGRARVNGEVVAVRAKLRAGRRGAHQSNAVTISIRCLVYMAPQYSANLRRCVGDIEQIN